MARTKQTARKSTGGNPPRRRKNSNSCTLPCPVRYAFHENSTGETKEQEVQSTAYTFPSVPILTVPGSELFAKQKKPTATEEIEEEQSHTKKRRLNPVAWGLNEDTTLLVFAQFTRPLELCNVELVNSQWDALSSYNSLWRNLFLLYFNTLPNNTPSCSSWKQLFIYHYVSHVRVSFNHGGHLSKSPRFYPTPSSPPPSQLPTIYQLQLSQFHIPLAIYNSALYLSRDEDALKLEKHSLATGQIQWSIPLPEFMRNYEGAFPTLDSDLLFLINAKSISAINDQTGKPVWTSSIDSQFTIFAIPIVSTHPRFGKRLFSLMASKKFVYPFVMDAKTGLQQWTIENPKDPTPQAKVVQIRSNRSDQLSSKPPRMLPSTSPILHVDGPYTIWTVRTSGEEEGITIYVMKELLDEKDQIVICSAELLSLLSKELETNRMPKTGFYGDGIRICVAQGVIYVLLEFPFHAVFLLALGIFETCGEEGYTTRLAVKVLWMTPLPFEHDWAQKSTIQKIGAPICVENMVVCMVFRHCDLYASNYVVWGIDRKTGIRKWATRIGQPRYLSYTPLVAVKVTGDVLRVAFEGIKEDKEGLLFCALKAATGEVVIEACSPMSMRAHERYFKPVPVVSGNLFCVISLCGSRNDTVCNVLGFPS